MNKHLRYKINYENFEKELENDFSSFEKWIKEAWSDLNGDDKLKENMFIITLNSLIENYFEKIIKYVFILYIEKNSGNHFYLSHQYFIESEKKRLEKIINDNHNSTYNKGLLKMLKAILNYEDFHYSIVERELEKLMKKKLGEQKFNDIKSVLGNINKDRNVLGHDFSKIFTNNQISFKGKYFKRFKEIKGFLKECYLSLEKIFMNP